jgi:hypothetical protein
MRNNLKIDDFDFEYTGSNYAEKDAIENGFKKLTGEELRKRIANKTFCGDYPMGYKFITNIYENGKAEGINHVGSHDFGHWVIDMKKHTLSLKWNNGWMNTTTHAYEINENIEFYDASTGGWRTTFKKCVNLKEEQQPAKSILGSSKKKFNEKSKSLRCHL